MVHAPIALLPNSFPESHFNQACELALIFNDLVDRVSLDSKFLQDTLESQLKAIGGQDSDVLENLMTAVRKRVEVLRGIQSEHDELEAKFFEEKAKYQKLIAALYSKRYDIVTGAVEVDGAKEEDAMDQTDDTDRLIVIMAGALVQPTSFPSTVSGENKVRSKRSGRTKGQKPWGYQKPPTK